MYQLYVGIEKFFELVQIILLARILLTWFPNINWYNQPFKALREFTDPILEPFKRLIPPIGGIDLSPLILFIIVLPLLETVILNIVKQFV